MLILGVDTSGKNGSIALVEFEQGSSRTLEVVPLVGGTFSAELVPQISDLLKRQGITKHDIGAFAVASGPGSFTGLRVGLAAIKALAEVLQKPIVAISVLEILVGTSDKDGEIVAALDAGRAEVYVGRYIVAPPQTTLREQQILPLTELAIGNGNGEVITSDAKIADFARERNIRVRLVSYPRADSIARVGFEKLKSGESISPEALDANYIRRSDAEIKKCGG